MATDLRAILDNVKEIYSSKSSLSTLLDVERVIDELDVYAFKNWKHGELIEGPVYEKYFVTCTFMWPYRLMPDPRGGEQLLNYNCLVSYEKDELEMPVKVKSQDDFMPGTKFAKKTKVAVWKVTITIPKKLLTEISQGAIALEDDTVDEQDIEQAYDEGIDTEGNQSEEGGQAAEQPAGAPELGLDQAAPGGAQQ